VPNTRLGSGFISQCARFSCDGDTRRDRVRALLLLSAFLLIGCASQPHRSVIHYSPPSVAPARHWVSNAQGHAKAIKDDLALLKKDEANRGLSKELLRYGAALDDAASHTDALTAELLQAQTALTDLEKKTSQQTDDLNQVIDDKNDALDRNAIIERKLKAIVGQRNKLLLVLLAAAAWIFRGPLLGLIKLFIKPGL
jgi:septal ring factor EnvC (AmiA/AmiB activator)